LTVKARGGPGEVIAFWQERGVDDELSLADLSDGILRFLCWATLSLMPQPPTLLCIDEPAQGIHPRVLPILAGLFQEASERTQVMLGTHASYFLLQFDLEHLAVMRKREGESEYIKPQNSEALRASLEAFGREEIEMMHRSDELEALL
jgi:predicted ATPase